MVGVGLLALLGEVTIRLSTLLVAGTRFSTGKRGAIVPKSRLGATTRLEPATYLDTVLQTVQLYD